MNVSPAFPEICVFASLAEVPAADKGGNDGGEEKPRPGDLHQRIALEQVFHDGIKGYETQHGAQHPEDAAHAIVVGIRGRHGRSIEG